MGGEPHGEEKELSFGEFMDMILQLRGSNTATVKDVVDLRKLINLSNTRTEEKLERIFKAFVRTTMKSEAHLEHVIEGRVTELARRHTNDESGLPRITEA